ncbi:MAG: PIN domain-containing protein [Nitrososphaerota archaeon]
MRLLPDTNVLVYDTIEDSRHHKEAAKIIDSAGEIFMPPIVIHEYIWVMLKLSISPTVISAKIHEYLEDVRTRPLHESIKVMDDALRMLEEEKAPAKDINDYIILSLTLNNNLTLATFDKELKTIALRKGAAVIP